MESVKTETFKFKPDKFPGHIPDEPKLPNYGTATGSNSILDQLTHLRAQGIYRSGGVLDSAMEQFQLLRNHSKYPRKNSVHMGIGKGTHAHLFSKRVRMETTRMI